MDINNDFNPLTDPQPKLTYFDPNPTKTSTEWIYRLNAEALYNIHLTDPSSTLYKLKKHWAVQECTFVLHGEIEEGETFETCACRVKLRQPPPPPPAPEPTPQPVPVSVPEVPKPAPKPTPKPQPQPKPKPVAPKPVVTEPPKPTTTLHPITPPTTSPTPGLDNSPRVDPPVEDNTNNNTTPVNTGRAEVSTEPSLPHALPSLDPPEEEFLTHITPPPVTPDPIVPDVNTPAVPVPEVTPTTDTTSDRPTESTDDDIQYDTYRLIATYGRRRNDTSLIDKIDAGDVPLLYLMQHYYDLYFIIRTKYDKKLKVLYFKDLPLQVQVGYNSISQYLAAIRNKTLPTLSAELPQHVKGEVYAWDALTWGFETKSMAIGYHPRAKIPEEDKQDLLLFKKGMDHYHAAKHSLISVNGFFHYYDYSENGWIVFGGNRTRQFKKNKTHINILDFTQVGEITLRRITDEMILPTHDGIPLEEGVYINTVDSMLGKTVGIVIGGYLHLLDHTYKRISDKMIKINFNNIRWESLYYQMRKNIDLSSLSITHFDDKESDRVIGFELYHDTTIRQLLTLPQSFLVFIHNPHVAVTEEQIGHRGIPHRYETGLPPIYPLRIGEGRYPAYKAIKNLDRWVICVEDNIVPLQVQYQKKDDHFHMIHDRIYPINGETYATAHFIRITSDRDLKTRMLDTHFDEMEHYLGSLQPFMYEMTTDDSDYRKDSRTQWYMPEKIIDIDFRSEYYQTQLNPLGDQLDLVELRDSRKKEEQV